jgi:hypothetical protein
LAAPRSRRIPALAAALLLCASCRRSTAPAPLETPELAPPEPSASLITTPLDKAATGYTNEMQAANLRRETDELDIREISKHLEEKDSSADGRAAPPPPSAAEKKERLARLKKMRLEFTRMRQGIDGARDKSVALAGSTAGIIPGRASGTLIGVIEDAPGIWSGAYGGAVETGERVVEDAAAWTELWGRLSRESPPALDFSASRVAAVFTGPRPTSGYRARLVAIETEPSRYLLRWLEEGPGRDEPVVDGATAPFLLVAVPKDDKAVRWEKLRRPERPALK